MALTKADIINTVQSRRRVYQTAEYGYHRNPHRNYQKHNSSPVKDVLISGFGKFCIRDKNERKGRNPATGDDLMLAPRRVVTFKCSGKLRDRIN